MTTLAARLDGVHFDELQRQAADRWSGVWTPAATFAFFDGHFPDHPLVPAAVLLEVSLTFLRVVTARPDLAARGARRCRFKGAVTPGARCVVEAAAVEPGVWSVVWRTPDFAGIAVDLELIVG